MTKRYPNIPAEIDAELSPKARKLFHDLIDDYERRFAELNKRIAGLEEKLQKLTPKNSSIPPSPCLTSVGMVFDVSPYFPMRKMRFSARHVVIMR